MSNQTTFDAYPTVEVIQQVGSDGMIVQAARVSSGNDLDAATVKTQTGLINFLVKNRHGSPFEHGSITFRVHCPIFVAREFMRHRAGWSYNETSGRYRELEPAFWVPSTYRPMTQEGKPGEYRLTQGADNRDKAEKAQEQLCRSYGYVWSAYREMLEAGIPREVARAVLPVGIYTDFYATANPRAVMHFLSLRTEDDRATVPSFPQQEIQDVAVRMEEAFEAYWPITYAAWNENGRVPV